MFLRPAEPGDADAVARVHVRSWQVGYRGLLPEDYLQGLRPEDRARWYNFAGTDPLQPATTVALEAGQICGFATSGPARDPDAGGCGEVLALYVDPAHWGRGVGAALVCAARARLVDLGLQHAVLWVVRNRSGERWRMSFDIGARSQRWRVERALSRRAELGPMGLRP